MNKFSSPVKQTYKSSQTPVAPRFTGYGSGSGTTISTGEASAANQGIHLGLGPIVGIAVGGFCALLALYAGVQAWRGRHDKEQSENEAVAPAGGNTTNAGNSHISHIV